MKINSFLARMEEGSDRQADADRALWFLLVVHRVKLPEINSNFVGKFRSGKVTGCLYTDYAMYCLLNSSKLFWKLLSEVKD